MVLGEIHTDKITVLLAELGAGSNGNIGLQTAQLGKLEDINLQLGQLQEQVAAALGGTGIRSSRMR